MIRVHKGGPAPRTLTNRGAKLTRVDCESYDVAPNDYVSGVRRFTYVSKVYAARSVKRALMATQCGKCCYCESSREQAELHVEHFRPKGSVRQDGDLASRELPGYYWLAYTWENLLLACATCNLEKKGDRFPLANPLARARNHSEDVSSEEPLLIDPSRLDPREHIRFRKWRTDPLTNLGRETRELLDLDRPKLLENRRKLFWDLAHHRAFVYMASQGAAVATSDLRRSQRYIDDAVLSKSEYSSMARDALDLPLRDVLALLEVDESADESGSH